MNPNENPKLVIKEALAEFLSPVPEDNILSEEETRTKLLAGILKGVDAIKSSYGSRGSNVVIKNMLPPYFTVTNDGKHILDSIRLKDPVENMGLNILKEITDKAEKESGDGRKTAIILAGAIIEEAVNSEVSPMDLKRSLDEVLPHIIASIDEQTFQIDETSVGDVARVSSESEEIGNIIQEVYTTIGQDGIIDIGNSGLPETSVTITEGVKMIGCGMHYPYMANGNDKKATYENPKVMVVKQTIVNIGQLDPIVKALQGEGISELVIFCDAIEMPVSQALAKVHMEGNFKALVIKAPTLWKDWLFEDFAKITGATVVDPAQGTTLKAFKLSYLGTCDKISTSKDETIVLGGKDLTEHIESILSANTDDAKLRALRLKTKTAIINVGANSETELFYKKAKASDARNASYLALQSGVVAGGGLTLLNASRVLPDTVGGRILKEALKAPASVILANSGETNEETINLMEGTFGYDSNAKAMTGMYEAGIIDPAIVVKNSITNALSVISTVLTTKRAIK